jgi:hypothetical protein
MFPPSLLPLDWRQGAVLQMAELFNRLYISVYHFLLCYLIICFSVGISCQNTTSTISGVFIVYLAT